MWKAETEKQTDEWIDERKAIREFHLKTSAIHTGFISWVNSCDSLCTKLTEKRQWHEVDEATDPLMFYLSNYKVAFRSGIFHKMDNN